MSLTVFFTNEEHMALVAQGRGKDIGVASILQFESLAQLCHGEREVTSGDIRLGDTRKLTFEFFLIETRYRLDAKSTTWEIMDRLVADEEMGILLQHLHAISGRNGAEASCFHQGGVRLIEIERLAAVLRQLILFA